VLAMSPAPVSMLCQDGLQGNQRTQNQGYRLFLYERLATKRLQGVLHRSSHVQLLYSRLYSLDMSLLDPQLRATCSKCLACIILLALTVTSSSAGPGPCPSSRSAFAGAHCCIEQLIRLLHTLAPLLLLPEDQAGPRSKGSV
jgi:hypothetical protein